MTKTSLFIIILLAACIAGYVLVQRGGGRIEAVRPARGPVVQAVYATGSVEPTVSIAIAGRVTARLVRLMADEGQTVTKGQVLAQLDDSDLRQTVAELQARADLAQKEYARKNALMKSGASSKQLYDEAVAARNTAQAAVQRAGAELDFLKLTAPEDGAIIRRDGEEGEIIPAGQAVFTLSRSDGLRISAEVDEEDIAAVQPGQNVAISADAFPGKTFNGTVSTVTPMGDAIARSYRVRIALDAGSPLMIGMTAETNIITGHKENALLLPASVMDNGRVWIFKDGRVIPVPVTTGAKTEQRTEIIEGLADDAVVVLHPDAGLKAGSHAQPVFATPPAR